MKTDDRKKIMPKTEPRDILKIKNWRGVQESRCFNKNSNRYVKWFYIAKMRLLQFGHWNCQHEGCWWLKSEVLVVCEQKTVEGANMNPETTHDKFSCKEQIDRSEAREENGIKMGNFLKDESNNLIMYWYD